jgi:L-2-hydroxyglutarate oxidase LhgO
MNEIKYLVIGAGVVGLSIAKNLTKVTSSVLVVEKNKRYGEETSSRNSEVIHAGNIINIFINRFILSKKFFKRKILLSRK